MISENRQRRLFRMQDARVALVAVGLLCLCVGVLVFAGDIAPRQYPAIIAWLIAALLVHDVLIAGVVFAVTLAGRRVTAGERVSFGIVAIVQGALAVGAIVALLVVPEIVKRAAGTANPSVLPLDYAANLGAYLIVLVLVTGLAIVLHVVLARHARR